MRYSPTTTLGTSRSGLSWTMASTRSATISSVFTGTGRFWHALSSPARTFSRSKGSRRPSFFTTRCGIWSMRS